MAVTRIPADQTSVFSSWSAPEVKEGQVVHVEKLKNRGPRGELINVDKRDVVYQTITAGQLEEISNQAYEEVREQAYQDGLKQGHAEGYQAGQEAIEQQVQNMKRTIANLHSYLNDEDDELEQALVNVSICIARAVLRRELSADSSHIQQVVREALAQLPMDSRQITIHLNEQDYECLNQLPDIPEQWRLQVDRTLSAGGCRVQSQHSVVDFTLEDQFQQAVNALVEKRFTELAVDAKERSEQRGNEPHPGP